MAQYASRPSVALPWFILFTVELQHVIHDV